MASWIPPNVPDDDAGAPVTISDLVTALGSSNVQLLNPQTTGHPVVTGTEFADSSAALSIDPGMLYYVVSAESLGFSVGGGLESMLRRAAAANASAVGLKAPLDALPTLAELGARTGVPILHFAQNIPWRYLDAMISRSLGERDWQGRPLGTGSGSLHDLVNALARIFGGAVAIEDLGRAVLAYSTHPGQLIDPLRTAGILGRHASQSPHNNARYRDVLRAEEALVFPGDGQQLPRAAIAVRSGTINLGSIWVIRSDHSPLTDAQHEALDTAAASAAGLMMESMRRATESSRARLEAVRKLLASEDLSASDLDELQIHSSAPLQLVAFQMHSIEVPPLIMDQIRALLGRAFQAMLGPTALVTVGHRFYALSQPRDAQGLQRLAQLGLEQVSSAIGQQMRAAVGSEFPSITDFAAARTQIDEILDAQLPGDVVTAQAAQPTLLLRAMARTVNATSWIRGDQVQALLDHDAAHDTDYGPNVLAWLRAHGNYAQAARDLDVHENTVRYRLRRARSQFHLNLDDPAQRLAAWVQLEASL